MDAVPGGKIKAGIGPIPGCGVGPDSLPEGRLAPIVARVAASTNWPHTRPFLEEMCAEPLEFPLLVK
jgi:hypothetical protein